MQAVCKGFKQELFEGCYKRIVKRIKAAKKKGNANKDLKGLGGKDMAKTIKAASDAASLISKKSLDKSKSIAVDDKKSKDASAKKPADATSKGTETAKVPKPEPLLDPHHFKLVLMGSKIKMEKFDKHPDPKDRRGKFKDMVTVEVSVECIQKEADRLEPLNSQLDGDETREASK